MKPPLLLPFGEGRGIYLMVKTLHTTRGLINRFVKINGEADSRKVEAVC